jgi:bifunctional non-homologous end joining protein LigD
MLLRLKDSVPVGNYAYEVKWDGIRAVAYIESGKLRLTSRNLLEITRDYPELQPLAREINGALILDGEIVVLNEKGVPDFGLLQHRFRVGSELISRSLSQSSPATYMLFDVLHMDGESLMDQPYLRRREILQSLNLNGTHWNTPPFFQGSPDTFLEATRQLHIEGIVAKQVDSPYVPGKRTDFWVKVKNLKRQEFVIGGWMPGQGARLGLPGALLLGYYDIPSNEAKRLKRPQKLIYAGKCGTGYSNRTLEDLLAKMLAIETTENPFQENIPRGRTLRFVRPELVGEFQFAGWTEAGMIRHSSFQGLRFDKKASDVVREDLHKEM